MAMARRSAWEQRCRRGAGVIVKEVWAAWQGARVDEERQFKAVVGSEWDG